jgi:lysophospholipase L1-like esterase
MKSTVKLIAVNLIIVGFLLSALNFVAISVIRGFNSFKPKQYAQAYLLPNYRNVDWAHQHFVEYDNLTHGYYKAFYGWRRPSFHGQTINLDADGLRRTYKSDQVSQTKTIAFFGGSTTWGTGANDDGTIPSFFGRANPTYEAINFGETGYIAHQSLNLFMKRYFDGFRPDVVVFYDGVNDVWNKCRRENDAFSTSREQQIRIALREYQETSYLSMIAPIRDLAGRVHRTLASRRAGAASIAYDCDQRPDKAEQVARFLLSDWMIVKSLVEGYGGKFIAILQPQAYGSKTRLDHLRLDADLGRQYAAVYPLVIDLLEKEFPGLKDNFVDLRTALDQDDYFYIDWCHLSPNGNQIIAQRISAAVAQRGMLSADAAR